MGREREEPTKFYHTSPYRLRYGQMLIPHRATWLEGESGVYGIFLTTSQLPHYTRIKDVMKSKKPWHVYEVAPIGDVKYGSTWDEAIADRAKVVKNVGNARGIVENKLKHFKIKGEDKDLGKAGSQVDPDIKPHGIKVRKRGSYYGAVQYYGYYPEPTPEEFEKRMEEIRKLLEDIR